MNQGQCKVPGCKQQHPSHFCRNCKDPDSDHYSNQCTFSNGMQNARQPFQNNNGFNQGNFNYPQGFNNQGFRPQGNFQQQMPFYQQQNNPQFFQKNRNWNNMSNGFPIRCKAKGCQQLHQYHFCKYCRNQDSDHKTSFCPYYQAMSSIQRPIKSKHMNINPQMRDYIHNKPQQVIIKIHNERSKSNDSDDQRDFKKFKQQKQKQKYERMQQMQMYQMQKGKHKEKPSYYSDDDD